MSAGSPAGPVEAFAFPASLTARVVDPGPPVRIRGYDVGGDLAQHYRFAEGLLLMLTGELPDEQAGKLFERLLWALAPAPVHEAPGHAALLARLCGATEAAIVSTGALALAEQAAHLAREHEAWLVWLPGPADAPPPSGFCAVDAADRAEAQALLAFDAELAGRLASHDPSAPAVLLGLLQRCGVRTVAQLCTLFVVARLPAVAAEAFAVEPASFRDYPMNLPRFEYEEGER